MVKRMQIKKAHFFQAQKKHMQERHKQCKQIAKIKYNTKKLKTKCQDIKTIKI